MTSTRETQAFLEATDARSRLMRTQDEAGRDHRLATDRAVEADRLIATANERVAALSKENEQYRNDLARPLSEILKENADYKRAHIEQQALIGLWMLRQRSLKKTAFDLAKKLNMSAEDVMSQTTANADRIMAGDQLEDLVGEEEMKHFKLYRAQILTRMKK